MGLSARAVAMCALSLLLLAGCEARLVELRLDLYTDYTPGADFERVDTVVTPIRSRSRGVMRHTSAPLRSGNAVRTPVRLLDLVVEPDSAYRVQVDVYRRGEAEVYKSTEATFQGQNDYALELWIWRDGGGDRCEMDLDCPGSGECLVGVCVGGSCTLETDNDLCPGDSLCDYDLGCVAPPVTCAPDAECDRPGLVRIEEEACAGCAESVVREREIRCSAECALVEGPWTECMPIDRVRASGLSVGAESGCAFDENGRLSCWGEGSLGRLGNGSLDDAWLPSRVAPDIQFRDVGVGTLHACGVDLSDRAYCWGLGGSGRLGARDDGIVSVPQPVTGEHLWSSITAGEAHSCGLTTGGAIYCWGQGSLGRLGTGEYRDEDRPARVGSDSDWAQVSAGGQHSCGVKLDGRGYCWGFNSRGQLGLGGEGGTYTEPRPVTGDRRWRDLRASSWEHSCGVDDMGALWCWGSCDFRQLGVGCRSGDRGSPQRLGTATDWVRVSPGYAHSCAINESEELWCWGWGRDGRIGNGGTDHVLTPVQIGVERGWRDVSPGRYQTCAIDTGGLVWCFGRNDNGELGVASRPDERRIPTLTCF